MVRGRQIGITEAQWEQLGRWRSQGRDRLTDSQRKHLKYNFKTVIEKGIEDLTRFFTEVGGLRACPFELVLPHSRNRHGTIHGDLGAAIDAIRQIEEWQAVLEKLKDAVAGNPQGYIR